LLSASASTSPDLSFLDKPSEKWTERQALQVLNDSPWAHTITTTTQDSPCTYQNPAFPGLFSEDPAWRYDLIDRPIPATSVKPDGAEYLVRFVAIKPIQAAVQRLRALQGQPPYHDETGPRTPYRPTNLAELYYNSDDLISVALILKRPGPDGASFLDYAFENKYAFPSTGNRLWPCAALRTQNGQVHAVMAKEAGSILGYTADGHLIPSGLLLSFPHLVDGKPLISHPDEKLEFRLILNQRVFETTFTINSADLLEVPHRYILREPATTYTPLAAGEN
jgi:hypothetical protein